MPLGATTRVATTVAVVLASALCLHTGGVSADESSHQVRTHWQQCCVPQLWLMLVLGRAVLPPCASAVAPRGMRRRAAVAGHPTARVIR